MFNQIPLPFLGIMDGLVLCVAGCSPAKVPDLKPRAAAWNSSCTGRKERHEALSGYVEQQYQQWELRICDSLYRQSCHIAVMCRIAILIFVRRVGHSMLYCSFICVCADQCLTSVVRALHNQVSILKLPCSSPEHIFYRVRHHKKVGTSIKDV